MDLRDAWDQTVRELSQAEILTQGNIAFLKMCHFVSEYNGIALVAVPNQLTKKQLDTRCQPTIDTTLSRIYGNSTSVQFLIDSSMDKSLEEEQEVALIDELAASLEGEAPVPVVEEENNELATVTPVPVAHSLRTAAESSEKIQTNLNPLYTFDTWVIGSSNRFAHAAAIAVAEMPATSYNPLFIYGDSGLGKTHLLHAIGHYSMKLFPKIKVKYVNSEEFTNDFINSIRSGKSLDFKQRYRKVDVLLIDDIQFLQGKEQTIEEFFHTFNTLHNDQKQVVITSDLPPKKLGGFEDRLRSRFEWGLLTDIQPPDLETRIAILRNRSRQENLNIPDEILEYIAEHFATNIRELEGALARIAIASSFQDTATAQPMSLEFAQETLKDIISDPQDHEITPSLIKTQAANYFDVTIAQLCSADRSKAITEARQITMYLCRELTNLSLPKIGDEFGGRDHTTVMYANKKISERMKEQPSVFHDVTELTNHIRQAARQRN
ncbi:MAG: chromosomal replication initiator protein DnaA [Actinomycetaceae bacterium]|nr:chromosomal replication initiator protein DnaA [Actinomycetaceae bacterium]